MRSLHAFKISTYLQELGTDGKDITYTHFIQELYIVKDVHINAYMKDLVMAWQANHDIQYVLEAYSCVIVHW